MNLIKLQNRIDIIFMNSENSKTSDPRRLLLNLFEKINLKRSDKEVMKPQDLLYIEKYKKTHTKIINFKYQLRHGMKSLNYLMGHVLYQILKSCLNTSKKT